MTDASSSHNAVSDIVLYMQAAEIVELRKMEEAKKRALDQKAVQTQQLEDLKLKILSERAENKREGVILKQRAIEEAEEMKRKEQERLEKVGLVTMRCLTLFVTWEHGKYSCMTLTHAITDALHVHDMLYCMMLSCMHT